MWQMQAKEHTQDERDLQSAYSWLQERQERVYDELNRLDPQTEGINREELVQLVTHFQASCRKIRFANWQPSIEIHAIGEADGDLTWFTALSSAEKELIS